MKQFLRSIWLTLQSIRVLLKVYALLTCIRLGLWLLPFEKLWKLLLRLGKLRQRSNSTAIDPKMYGRAAQKAIWAVNTSCKFTPGGAKCLTRALTVKVLLDRWNCPSDFKIGVIKNSADRLEAHAWIEMQGQVIIGQLSNLDRYTPMPPLPTY
ncbi:lasso peptide biosynthesis B2 protein [Altericista sp. CCNU0014]|uniref:lasso peptide biosynthesis B2 protein n=1 Tax=Altericista sp. CCNU0014 TaxID=3082949 RepID=UPI00384C309B